MKFFIFLKLFIFEFFKFTMILIFSALNLFSINFQRYLNSNTWKNKSIKIKIFNFGNFSIWTFWLSQIRAILNFHFLIKNIFLNTYIFYINGFKFKKKFNAFKDFFGFQEKRPILLIIQSVKIWMRSKFQLPRKIV